MNSYREFSSHSSHFGTTSTTSTKGTTSMNPQSGGYKGKPKPELKPADINKGMNSFCNKPKSRGSGEVYEIFINLDTLLFNYCNGNINPKINVFDVLDLFLKMDRTDLNIKENDTFGRKLLFKILNNDCEIPQNFFEKLSNVNNYPQGQLYLFLLWCCLNEESPIEKLKECIICLSSQKLQDITSVSADAVEAAKATLESLHPDVFDMNLLLNNCHSQGSFKILENLSESLCVGMHHSYLSSKEIRDLNLNEWFTLMGVYVTQILGNKRDLNYLVRDLMKRFGSYKLNDAQLKCFAELALYSYNPHNCILYPRFLKQFIDLDLKISQKADRPLISSSKGILSLNNLGINWPNLFPKIEVQEPVNTLCWKHDNTITNTNPGTFILFFVKPIHVLDKNNEAIFATHPTLIVSDTNNEKETIYPKESIRRGNYFTSAKGGGPSTFSNSGSQDDFKGGYPISKDDLSFMGYLHHPHFKNRYVNLSVNNDKKKHIFIDDEIYFYTRGLQLFLVPMTFKYEQTVNHSQINEIGEFLKKYIFFV